MTGRFTQRTAELAGLAGARLADLDGLSGAVLAAAGAIGLSSYGPPIVKSGPHGVLAGLLCHGGHIIVHTVPGDGTCVVDILARAPANLDAGIEVITKRLAAR
ncbi:MAG TPA: S-adenosylmethionine decarboxylase [Gemmatimonadales bacterium]|nr:S-adenosylmethionine decarboxylase [Gemmatimonadales bacterium]